MITTSDTFAIEDDNKRRFAGASVYCVPMYNDDIETTGVEVRVVDDVSATDVLVLASIRLEFTNTELTAFTASGANDILKYYNLVEQAVKDYLEGITANSAATFTIT